MSLLLLTEKTLDRVIYFLNFFFVIYLLTHLENHIYSFGIKGFEFRVFTVTCKQEKKRFEDTKQVYCLSAGEAYWWPSAFFGLWSDYFHYQVYHYVIHVFDSIPSVYEFNL